mmetsp:Transcript_2503/g.3308  ORF Transcript_2503/g.3308 Transcript_2503/m.3308 type:complete len:424 (-) Transcript_2503:40-1311(-)
MADRVKRRAAKKKPNVNPSYLVGYVEDGETVEMIMKKFEVMDKIQQEQAQSEEKDNVSPTKKAQKGSGVLSEKSLNSLFQQTSYFTPDVVAEDLGMATGNYSRSFYDEYYLADGGEIDELDFYISDEDDQLDEGTFWDTETEWDSETTRRRKKEKEETSKSRGVRTIFEEVEAPDGQVYTVKKKIREVDPNEPVFMRVPPEPIPISWGKLIHPYSDDTPPANVFKYVEADILSYDFKKELKQCELQAILMDPPWRLPGSKDHSPKSVTADMIEKMKLQSMIPKGLIFMWVEKEVIIDAVTMMENWGFQYVENLVWLKQDVNNKIAKQEYSYFRKSKKTLLIFKNADGLELRHQRNPDVVFDFVRERYQQNVGNVEEKPEFVYHIIETLLPNSKYDGKSGNFKLLELWGQPGRKRPGWVSVVQK